MPHFQSTICDPKDSQSETWQMIEEATLERKGGAWPSVTSNDNIH